MSDADSRVLSWGELFGPEYLLSITTLCLGITLHAVNFFIFATLAPSVVADLGELEWLHWATTLYVVASIVSSAAGGMIRARLGPRRALGFAILGFAIGSAGVGLAPDMTTVLVMRAIQGLGAGLLLASSHGLVRDLFPASSWARVFAAISGVWGIAALTGPLIGGIFAELDEWRLGFIVMLPLCLILYLAVLRSVPAGGRRPQSGGLTPILRLALIGAAALAIGGTGGAGPVRTTALVALAGVLLLTAILWERRSAEPLFPHAMFRPGTVLGGSVMYVFFMSFGSASTAIYAPYFLSALHAVPPLATGYVVTAQSMCWTIASLAVSGALGARASLWIAVGPAIAGIGCLGAALYVPHGPLWAAIAAFMVLGTGIGLAWSHVAKRIFDAAGEADRDRVTSVIPTTQALGVAFGSAAAGIVADRAGLVGTPPLPVIADAAHLVFLFLLPAIALALTGALRSAYGRT
ncbi:major facilitator superfamily protein superfamily [alpha proteobacterium BAL199]|jgi:MFS family permease|nr:major facilitator superfamily protein superfamily [alpha proteobacterium BAL199]